MKKTKASWSISKEELIPGLEILDLVPPRPGVLASEFIKVRKGSKTGRIILTLASEFSARVTIQGQGEWPFAEEIFLDRRLFLPFIRVEKTVKTKALFEVLSLGDRIIVKHGRRKAKFSKVSVVSGYGELPAKEKSDGTQLRFSPRAVELMQCAKEFATGDSTRPELNCVYMVPGKEKKTVVLLSSNSWIIFKGHIKVDRQAKEQIPFPLFLVPLLKHEGLKKVTWRGDEVVLDFGLGKVWQTLSLKAKDKFPEEASRRALAGSYMNPEWIAWSNLRKAKRLKRKAPTKWLARDVQDMFKVDCKTFSTFANRLVAYLSAVRRQDWALELKAEDGKNEILMRSTVPQGEFQERLRVPDGIPYGFDVVWPLDILVPIFEFWAKGKGDSVLKVIGDKETKSAFFLLRAKGIEMGVSGMAK